MANQNSMGLVGHNMSNVNTEGYTRQQLDVISLSNTNPYSPTMVNPLVRIGNGIMMTGVSQIRDPFLDERYRAEMSNLAGDDRRLELLQKLGDIFDETDKEGLDTQLNDLLEQFTVMSENVSGTNDALVRASAQTLTNILNQYANSIDATKEYTETLLDEDVKAVNDILEEVSQLNQQIKNAQVYGDGALELQDARNLLLDELSAFVNIDITTTTEVTINGNEIGSVKVDLIAADNSRITLINDVSDSGSFTINAGPPSSISVTDYEGTAHADHVSSSGTIQSTLDMLNDKGEFGTPPTTERGIPYYEEVLNSVASTLAETFNTLNNVAGTTGAGNLFASKDGGTTITAGNITLSEGWLDGTITIQPHTSPDAPAQDNTNILNFMNALTKDISFSSNGVDYFTGTFQENLSNMTNIQGLDQKSTESSFTNYFTVVNSLADSRDSVSGVSIDEETMTMMQLNNSLNAASRYLTTLDESLQTIISSMGLVGR